MEEFPYIVFLPEIRIVCGVSRDDESLLHTHKSIYMFSKLFLTFDCHKQVHCELATAAAEKLRRLLSGSTCAALVKVNHTTPMARCELNHRGK